MEMVKAALSLDESESNSVAGLTVHPKPDDCASFYEGFALRGITVDSISAGSLTCTFKVPHRLTDLSGNMSAGAIANLVDEIGWAAVAADGMPMKVSVDMSISFMSAAKLNDELEITSRALGHKGGYSGSHVLLKNRTTGRVVAEGRHSLFGKPQSKM